MEPSIIITLISSGLKLIDQFRELVIKFRKQPANPPSGKAEQVGTSLQVSYDNKVYQTIDPKDLKMDQFDTVRYDALRKRIQANWNIYNDLFANEAVVSAQEGARIREDIRKVQETLCTDFKEMVQLYERTLGTSLPDHYQLFEVCPQ